MAKIIIGYYSDKKVNNAIKKLVNKYGWYTNQYMSWDWGHVFWKREYDEKHYTYYNVLECSTTINGVNIRTDNYLAQYPTITYQELRLFKVISDYYKKEYEEEQKLKLLRK